MRRNYLVMLLIVIAMFLLTACGNNGVAEKQLKEDIISRDEIQNCYRSQFVGGEKYIIKEYTLIKEQYNKENKEDLIFCEIVLDNEYFEVKVNAEIVYNYYDKGGWVMDELSVQMVEVNPIKAPDVEEVLTVIKAPDYDIYYGDEYLCYYNESLTYVDGGELRGVSSEYNASEKSAKMYSKYVNATMEVTGWFEMRFENNEWAIKNTAQGIDKLVLIAENLTTDYSMALGEFEWEPRKHPNSNAILLSAGKLVVYDITGNSIRYGIWFDEEPSETWYSIEQGDNLTATFDLLTGSFSVGDSFAYSGTELTEKNKISLGAGFYYDASNDEWHGLYLDAERR